MFKVLVCEESVAWMRWLVMVMVMIRVHGEGVAGQAFYTMSHLRSRRSPFAKRRCREFSKSVEENAIYARVAKVAKPLFLAGTQS